MRASTPLATLCAVAALAGAPRLALAEGECAAAAEAYGLVSSRCLAELLTTRGGVKKSACDTDCYTDFVAAADALSAAVAVDQSCQDQELESAVSAAAMWGPAARQACGGPVSPPPPSPPPPAPAACRDLESAYRIATTGEADCATFQGIRDAAFAGEKPTEQSLWEAACASNCHSIEQTSLAALSEAGCLEYISLTPAATFGALLCIKVKEDGEERRCASELWDLATAGFYTPASGAVTDGCADVEGVSTACASAALAADTALGGAVLSAQEVACFRSKGASEDALGGWDEIKDVGDSSDATRRVAGAGTAGMAAVSLAAMGAYLM